MSFREIVQFLNLEANPLPRILDSQHGRPRGAGAAGTAPAASPRAPGSPSSSRATRSRTAKTADQMSFGDPHPRPFGHGDPVSGPSHGDLPKTAESREIRMRLARSLPEFAAPAGTRGGNRGSPHPNLYQGLVLLGSRLWVTLSIIVTAPTHPVSNTR